jgi:hypothetical protein
MEVRYVAEWIAKQHQDERGEWDPDRDEFEFSVHRTKADAEHAAVKAGKRCAAADWVRVSFETKGPHGWEEERRWCGDWDGNWNEVR